MFDHVGLLVNRPPALGGLPFISSTDYNREYVRPRLGLEPHFPATSVCIVASGPEAVKPVEEFTTNGTISPSRPPGTEERCFDASHSPSADHVFGRRVRDG